MGFDWIIILSCVCVCAWTVEQAGPLVIAGVQQLLDFAICYLEKSEFSSDDFSVQVCHFSDMLKIRM